MLRQQWLGCRSCVPWVAGSVPSRVDFFNLFLKMWALTGNRIGLVKFEIFTFLVLPRTSVCSIKIRKKCRQVLILRKLSHGSAHWFKPFQKCRKVSILRKLPPKSVCSFKPSKKCRKVMIFNKLPLNKICRF